VTSCRRPGPLRPRAALAGLVLLLATACAADGTVPAPVGSGPGAAAAVPTSGQLVVVLPPADGLAEPERSRVRMLVERALESESPASAPPLLLEPATAGALVDTVELALRRAGPDGTVCVLGASASAAVAAARSRYPAPRLCLLPPEPASERATERVEGEPGDATSPGVVDIELLGRELGAAARAAAGPGSVLVLVGGDAMLDRRWRTGVTSGAPVSADAPGTSGVVHSVASAAELIAILDEQAALLRSGIVPGGRDAGDGEGPVPLPDDELPVARRLPPVGVVVLDASPEAGALVAVLADRGVPVIAPRSLLLAAGAPETAVVLRWRIRWDVALGALLRSLGVGAAGPAPSGDDLLVLVLEAGPAYVGP